MAERTADRPPLPRRAVVATPGGREAAVQMHVQAWLTRGPPDGEAVLHLRLTDGVNGWRAELGQTQLTQLAVGNHFGAQKLGEYLQHTLASFATAPPAGEAGTAFELASSALATTLSWSRSCLIDNMREKVGGCARVERSAEVLAGLHAELKARLTADAQAIRALDRSALAIEAETRRVERVTAEADGRLAALEEALLERFAAELNVKKRALREARAQEHEDSDTDREECSDAGEEADERALRAAGASDAGGQGEAREPAHLGASAPRSQPAHAARRSAMDMLADDSDDE